jgi:hypothetical protein
MMTFLMTALLGKGAGLVAAICGGMVWGILAYAYAKDRVHVSLILSRTSGAISPTITSYARGRQTVVFEEEG